MQRELGLGEGKLAESRSAMRQYGNTRSSCVILVMEEMRLRTARKAWIGGFSSDLAPRSPSRPFSSKRCQSIAVILLHRVRRKALELDWFVGRFGSA
ncbi:hypothetical protein C2845_PM06G25170 [Panicum miliaceum]|uniref:Chalcone/stilbene synthase C-terminal domain-containing protein n=1 Tax=Panicum miliaceum TaxID=4540 RepID=A0A3L6RD26_PANMI|nr:hypothetical protein C2845_PM06G25170 [Panicum miliaceum]